MQNKLSQQDQLTKQLRKKQKDLKENAGAMTNQKTNFSYKNTIIMTTTILKKGLVSLVFLFMAFLAYSHSKIHPVNRYSIF